MRRYKHYQRTTIRIVSNNAIRDGLPLVQWPRVPFVSSDSLLCTEQTLEFIHHSAFTTLERKLLLARFRILFYPKIASCHSSIAWKCLMELWCFLMASAVLPRSSNSPASRTHLAASRIHFVLFNAKLSQCFLQ